MARQRRGPFKSRAQAGPRAAGAQSAARVGGVGSRRKSFLPTPAPRAAAAAHSSPGPGAGPATVARATARGRARRAAPAVSLWRVQPAPPPAPGRPAASPRPLPALGLPRCCRGAAATPGRGATRGTTACASHVPRRGAAPGGQTPVRPGPAREPGQDESDSVLRQDRHRSALQGRPAARPRAHPAGAAALPEDPGPGEGRCRGGEAARPRRGSASALGHAPAGLPGPSGALYGTQITPEAGEHCLRPQLLQAANERDPGSPALSLRALGGMEPPPPARPSPLEGPLHLGHLRPTSKSTHPAAL